jgi:carbon monoxide dehydrogenase subunit G
MARTPLGDEDYNSTPGVFGGQTISGRDHAAEGRSLSLTRGGIMPTGRATHSATISAPPQKVYDFVAEASRATSFIPGLSRIHNVQPATAQPGQTWEYEFDWFGLVVSGNSKCTRSERPKVFEFQTVTGNPSTWTYKIEPSGENARVTLDVQYEIPGNVVARFASQPVFEKMNQDRAREIISNLKTMLES